MKKITLEFSVIVVFFFAVFLLLNQIDWISILKIEHAKKTTEEKLGVSFWQYFSRTEKEIQSKEVTKSIDTLVNYICDKNSIDKSKIKIHILQKDEVNAFTLPDNYIVIYSGLISSTENEAELLGIIGHEIAHMEKGHIMKKLVKEIGLSTLIAMTSGGGGETIKEIAKLLSSSAYDRDLEREADLTSVDYLIKADIDPEPFANFMFRMSEKEKNTPDQIFWITTHPNSEERAKNIIEYIKGKNVSKKTVLSEEEWSAFKKSVSDY